VRVSSKMLLENEKSALLLGDIGVYGFRDVLDTLPERVFNIGILEQSMVGVAAGLSSEGIIPTIHTIAPFMVERALEQIKIDFAYQGFSGNLVSVGASFDYAALGCTHHCPGDVNLMSNIPGADIYIPGHAEEFAEMFERNWNNGNLNYFRLSEQQNTRSIHCGLGSAVRITNGELGSVIAVGPILEEVVSAIEGMSLELHYVSSFAAARDIKISVSNSSKKTTEQVLTETTSRKVKANQL